MPKHCNQEITIFLSKWFHYANSCSLSLEWFEGEYYRLLQISCRHVVLLDCTRLSLACRSTWGCHTRKLLGLPHTWTERLDFLHLIGHSVFDVCLSLFSDSSPQGRGMICRGSEEQCLLARNKVNVRLYFAVLQSILIQNELAPCLYLMYRHGASSKWCLVHKIKKHLRDTTADQCKSLQTLFFVIVIPEVPLVFPSQKTEHEKCAVLLASSSCINNSKIIGCI